MNDAYLQILDDTFAAQMQQLLGNSLREQDLEPPRSIMEVRSILCKDTADNKAKSFYYWALYVYNCWKDSGARSCKDQISFAHLLEAASILLVVEQIIETFRKLFGCIIKYNDYHVFL